MTLRRRPQTATRTLPIDLLLALAAAIGGTAWLSWLDASDGVRPNDLVAVINESATVLGYSLPLVMMAVPALLAVIRRRGLPATAPAAVIGIAAASAASVSLGSQLRLLLGGHPAAGLRPGALLSDSATLFVVFLAAGVVLSLLLKLRTTTLRTATRAMLVLAISVTGSLTAAFSSAAPVNASISDTSCLAGGPVDKSFDVTAIDVDIPVNRFGDHDPKGKMYALTSALDAIPAEAATQTVSIGLGDDPIQPLAIRANEGDCVEIHFTNNATGGDYGMHIDGLEFDQTSSGDHIGANPSSAVPNGQSTTYRYAVPLDNRLEGAHYIHPGPGYRSAVDHGLFGALIVEPPGSTYWDASTADKPLDSGWEAIIKPAGVDVPCDKNSDTPTCAFREAVLMHHEIGNDNEQLTDKHGNLVPLVDNLTGSYRPGSFALNYRSEPFRNRLTNFPKEKAHSYSSFTFGDPATPIMRGYLADPTKIRLLHAGGEKFHVFHLHGGGDRWRFNPVGDPTFNYADTGLHKTSTSDLSPSQRLDSQAIGPGESYNLEIEGGAGGVQQSVGDFLFHCHIAKHYVSGMWAMWRVFNTRQPDLVPLGDRNPPPTAVDSRGLIGHTYNGVKLTKTNLDAWIRPQLPPAGVPRDGQDPNVWDWKIAGTSAAPLYLGAPGDPTLFPDSVQVIPNQPNLLAVDAGHLVGDRPAIMFDPDNGRPAYPMLRANIGKRPPFTAMGHSGAPYLGNTANQASTSATDPFAKRPDGLCPTNTGGKLRNYNVVAIGKGIRRTPSFIDPEGKIFVLAHNNTAAFRADPDQGEPLAIRANQGDCVAITLTNEIPDASAFDKFSKVEMHIHHVQFDVQGSDGVSTGYAFEHSVRPYTVTDASLTAGAAKGATVLHLTDVTKFIETDANGKPSRPWIAVGEGLETIDIHQIASVNPTNKTITLATKLNSAHGAGEFAGNEYVQYRWYPDVLLDNVFWHDHVDGIHGWGHGLVGQLIVEPKGSTYHDPKTGAEVDSGTLVDIHTSSPLSPGLVNGSFRELALWTINDNDAGQYSTLNLKANPLVDRLDKADQFSSYTYGDPLTPLPRLYPDDPLVVRSISVSPTVDTLHIQGGKTLLEPRQTDGTVIDTVHGGISEKYSLILNGNRPDLRMQPGDYLYNNGVETHTQQGAWGIVRVLPGQVSDLLPLPGVATPSSTYTLPASNGAAPPPTASPGNPCPAGAPTRRFNVSAMDRSATLNGARTGYVPNGDVAAVKAKTKPMQPLVLHVVAGECVTVNVTNLLTTPVGFSVGKLDRAAGSGGVNVGFDSDQNVAPNATRAYVYYVPTTRVGTAAIADLSSGSTLKNGLYGTVVVAPASKVAGQPTEFSDPVTGAARDIGPQVIVHVPGGSPQDYRDFTVTVADDDASIGQDFMPYPTDARVGRSLINYQAAPAGDGPDAFVDPGAVPTLTAFAGDPVVVHTMVSPGSESMHVFSLGGLSWERDPFLATSEVVDSQGIGPWETYDSWILGGAGGLQNAAGDYFYGDLRRPFTAVGLWGLQRVLPADTTTCPILRVDGSAC